MSSPGPEQGAAPLAAREGRIGIDALQPVLVYAAFAALWILLSDEMMGLLYSDPVALVRTSMVKGWLFVAVTSLLLYGLIRRLLDKTLAASRREIEAQAAKARALQLLDAIVESSTDAIYALDADGRFILFNPAAERNVGKKAAEVLGRDETAIFPAAIAEPLIAANREVLAGNRTLHTEDEVPTTGGMRTFLTTKGPLHDGAGQVIGLFGISRDITERQQAETALRQTIEELERFNRVAIGRELDMIGLKRQVNDLSRQLGLAAPYAMDFADAPATGARD